jgi:phage major head subunit gpT-like protein
MGIIASEQFAYLLDPGLRKIFMDEFGMPGDMVSQLYSQEKSNKAVEYDLGIGGMGDLEEFTGTIPYGDFRQQYRVSYSHREWVKGIKIERKLVDDDLYNVINARPRQLAVIARRTREKHGASLFNNAFNTSVFAGGDALSLCNTAHTYVGTSTTVGNSGTTALSATAMEATRLLGMALTDETDNLMDVVYDTLLVPPNLEETAWQIIKTDKQVDSANNNANFNMGRYKLLVWNRLTDTNNWFMIDSKYMKLFLKWFNRIPVEFNKDKDFDTYVAKWSVYTRYSYGFSDWRWIYGHNVS